MAADQIPIVETARLRLRGHRAEDFDDCAAMWADPSVVRHIGGRPFPAEETWTKILRYAGLWALLGFGYWAVEEKASGRYVGDVGLADFKRDVQPSFDGAPEIGWALAPLGARRRLRHGGRRRGAPAGAMGASGRRGPCA